MNSSKPPELRKNRTLSSLDIHFANFINGLDSKSSHEVFMAAALASNYNREGHICLDLAKTAGTRIELPGEKDLLTCPALKTWTNALEQSSAVGKPGEFTPLVLDEKDHLYLYRYWEYQEELARHITKKTDGFIELDMSRLKLEIDRLFPAQTADDEIDLQKLAACVALLKKICIISGGPGTGKTSTVVKIMALILELFPGSRIALTAPTGKAAARLQAAIRNGKQTINCDDHVKNSMPEQASTIHRLLGSIPGSPYFRYNTDNPLLIDTLIVDEASMIDLALMSKLVQAVPDNARLIFLGDKNQLASVEAGAVFGDICNTGPENAFGFSPQFAKELKKIITPRADKIPIAKKATGLNDSVVILQKSYRFRADSGICEAGQTVNTGDGEGTVKLLKESNYKDITWKELPSPGELEKHIRAKIIIGFKPYLNAANTHEAFKQFESFRILCALRRGHCGVIEANQMAERILEQEGLIHIDQTWYKGRPIIITANDYNLKLFNGDTGIALPDPDAANELRVFFPAEDGSLRRFHPLRLPGHETAYATTIHKSQGSEFNDILLLLPDRDSQVFTRELIYTGITRSRKSVEIWGDTAIFKTAVSRKIERVSGLRDALWEA